VTWTYIEAFCPWTTELGTCAKVTVSVGSGGDDGVVVGVAVVEAFVVPGVVLGGVADALAFDGDGSAAGDGVSAARVAGAAPLTRTSPVPTQMISGLRTDRASTAHDLLNNRL
jgi:hypothetical protein